MVWGSLQSCTVGVMLATVARFCPAFSEKLEVRRKFKTNVDKKVVRWRFLIRGDETTLADVEKCWESVFLQTSWKWKCWSPSDVIQSTVSAPPAGVPAPVPLSGVGGVSSQDTSLSSLKSLAADAVSGSLPSGIASSHEASAVAPAGQCLLAPPSSVHDVPVPPSKQHLHDGSFLVQH